MRTLLLTSAGMVVKDEMLKILPKDCDIRVGHIITASKVKEDKSYVEKEREQMRALGWDFEDVDIDGLNENELFERLSDKNVIYVQGGDSFYLLKCVKESGFNKVVKNLIDKGLVYIGVSAGSYIACPNIEMALWKNSNMNTFGLEDLNAMNLVPFVVTCHYHDGLNDLIRPGILKSKYPVKILKDNQAILVRDDRYELVGDKSEIYVSDL